MTTLSLGEQWTAAFKPSWIAFSRSFFVFVLSRYAVSLQAIGRLIAVAFLRVLSSDYRHVFLAKRDGSRLR